MWGTAIIADEIIQLIMAYASRSGLFPGLGGVLWPVTFLVLQQQHHRIETRPSSLRHAFLHVRHRERVSSQTHICGTQACGGDDF
jgi:hypothetical protein